MDVVRSEEHHLLTTRPELVGRVRVSKRIVTEERTLTVSVRREELVVERLDVGHGALTRPIAPQHDTARPTEPLVEMTLHEEVVETTTRVIPTERVRVFRDVRVGSVDVDEALGHEVVTLNQASRLSD